MVYIVENNGVYGLTKGQFSATADKGSKAKRGAVNSDEPIDLVQLALLLGAAFVARGFSGDKGQLVPLIKAAVEHGGAAFIDVVSPCVAFNNHPGSTKSYDYVRAHNEAVNRLDFMPLREPITADVAAGERRERRAARRRHRPPAQAARRVRPARQGRRARLPRGAPCEGRGRHRAALVEDDPIDLHEAQNTVAVPFNALGDAELVPGARARRVQRCAGVGNAAWCARPLPARNHVDRMRSLPVVPGSLRQGPRARRRTIPAIVGRHERVVDKRGELLVAEAWHGLAVHEKLQRLETSSALASAMSCARFPRCRRRFPPDALEVHAQAFELTPHSPGSSEWSAPKPIAFRAGLERSQIVLFAWPPAPSRHSRSCRETGIATDTGPCPDSPRSFASRTDRSWACFARGSRNSTMWTFASAGPATGMVAGGVRCRASVARVGPRPGRRRPDDNATTKATAAVQRKLLALHLAPCSESGEATRR